jgi:hypothetical protein
MDSLSSTSECSDLVFLEEVEAETGISVSAIADLQAKSYNFHVNFESTEQQYRFSTNRSSFAKSYPLFKREENYRAAVQSYITHILIDNLFPQLTPNDIDLGDERLPDNAIFQGNILRVIIEMKKTKGDPPERELEHQIAQTIEYARLSLEQQVEVGQSVIPSSFFFSQAFRSLSFCKIWPCSSSSTLSSRTTSSKV